MSLEALFNAVVVKPVEFEEQMYGNIVVPDMGKEKNQTAEIIAVGPGHYSVTGTFIETVLQPGDVVVLPTMGFVSALGYFSYFNYYPTSLYIRCANSGLYGNGIRPPLINRFF